MAGCGVEQEIAASAEAAWRRLSDVGSVHEWGPGIRACRLEGRGVGAVRTLELSSMTFRERIDALDEATRTFRYSILSGPMPGRDYRAEVRVEAAGPGRARVFWSCRFEAPELAQAELAHVCRQLEEAYRGMIAALERALRSQEPAARPGPAGAPASSSTERAPRQERSTR
jgi:carbon monoxide dehydrogenase subunit G